MGRRAAVFALAGCVVVLGAVTLPRCSVRVGRACGEPDRPPGRQPSLIDVVTDAAGAAIGVLAPALLSWVAAERMRRRVRR